MYSNQKLIIKTQSTRGPNGDKLEGHWGKKKLGHSDSLTAQEDPRMAMFSGFFYTCHMFFKTRMPYFPGMIS